MKILKFIKKESQGSYRQLLLMAIISGIANSLLLTIINHAAQAVAMDEELAQYFMLYIVMFVLFLYTQWIAYEKSIILIEETIYNKRIRLSRKIRRVELSFVEKIGSSHLYTYLTKNDTFISQTMPQLIAGAQMSILVIFSFIYLAYISPLTFFISMVMIAMAIMIFSTQTKSIKTSLQAIKKKEDTYFDTISDMVNGFKEIKVNRKIEKSILAHITEISSDSKQLKIDIGRKESRMWGFGRSFIYAILPILVFIIPSFSYEHSSDIFKITATLLFIVSPITFLVNTLPLINQTNLVIDELTTLETEIDQASSNFQEKSKDYDEFKNFKKLTLENINFSYPDAKNTTHFSIGPFNQVINAGELLFVIGANGSGKSTFLKLLVGLYYPINGDIKIDASIINKNNYPMYRHLFSVVFTDFHLFRKLYGLQNIKAESVNKWIKKMRMQHKVQYKNLQFIGENLSIGQKKRLAFISAVLEDKPILILDEFAADQDPQFRQYFYEEILVELRNSGKTIIAVTHDDHYFHIANRVLKMDNGKLLDY
jgi:putative ATP-binding cassette transporter